MKIDSNFRFADYSLGIPESEAQRQEFGSLYAPASNGWSFAPRIRSHKIAAGSPNVNGMFANRLTISCNSAEEAV
jgi:hypothetical protein